MEKIIKVIVTEENKLEVLKRRQNGENICNKCVTEAFNLVKNKTFCLPDLG